MKKFLKYNLLVLFSVLFITLQPLQLYSSEPAFQQKDSSRFSTIASIYNKQEAFDFVKELTKDDYAGRSSGTEGCDKAATWIANQFKKWNLHPYHDSSYLQEISSALTFTKTSNVIGYIPSIDRDSKDSIVIGAHYDHIGKDPSGKIFRGANDNASGIGVMMEVARSLTTSILINHINIVFIAFSAEEKGLIGSYFYVKNPLFPVKNILTMINLDMVGTGIGSWEVTTNFERNKSLNQVLTKAFGYYKKNYRLAPEYLKPVSDHYPFYSLGVPILFLIRGNPTHIGGYHTLKDTIDTIDQGNLEECGKLSILVILLVGKNQIEIFPRYEINFEMNRLENIPCIPQQSLGGYGLIFSDCSL